MNESLNDLMSRAEMALSLARLLDRGWADASPLKVSLNCLEQLIAHIRKRQIDDGALKRAIYMLRVAGVHCGEFAAEQTTRYDDAVCDGSCIEGDCETAAAELERLLAMRGDL